MRCATFPALVLAVPSRGDDAARMLRGAIAMALEDGRVVVFLEPIALYHEKDLHEPRRRGLADRLPGTARAPAAGRAGGYEPDGADASGRPDLLIVSYANGLRLSLQAQRRLAAEHGIRARVLDLRWLNPLPTDALRRHAAEAGAVLVVDECRRTGGGVADAIIADLAESGATPARGLASVRAVDSFVPLGPVDRHGAGRP